MRKKQVRVLFSLEFLLDFITTGSKFGDGEILECIVGIPKGSKIVDAFICGLMPPTLEIVLEHDSFDPVIEGAKAPTINPVMRRTIKDE